MENKELIAQLITSDPFISKIKHKQVPANSDFLRVHLRGFSVVPYAAVEPVEIVEELVPLQLTAAIDPLTHFADFSSAVRSVFSRAFALGKTKYLGAVVSVEKSLTPFGTFVPVAHVEPVNRFLLDTTESVLITRLALTETDEGVCFGEEAVFPSVAVKRLSDDTLVLENADDTFLLEPDDRIYATTKFQTTGLPEIFNESVALHGATISNLPLDSEESLSRAVCGIVARYTAPTKVLMSSPKALARCSAVSSLQGPIITNVYLPDDRVYLLDTSDFTLIHTEPLCIENVANFTADFAAKIGLVCENPANQLCIKWGN